MPRKIKRLEDKATNINISASNTLIKEINHEAEVIENRDRSVMLRDAFVLYRKYKRLLLQLEDEEKEGRPTQLEQIPRFSTTHTLPE